MDVEVWVMRLEAGAARAARDRILAARPGRSASFSDSGEVSVVAVAERGTVGVDVERVRERPRMSAVAGRVLAPRDARRVATARGADRLACFYRAWTAAEASAKARGDGLPALLGDRALPAVPVTWFDPAPGYMAALATSAGSARVVRRHA